MNRKLRKTNIVLVASLYILLICIGFIGVTSATFCSTNLEDGIYEAPFITELTSMGMMAFENSEKKVIVEKRGAYYFVTASFSDSVKDIKLLDSKGKVGETIVKDGTVERHTYTFSESSINNDLKFSVFIKDPMNKTKEFTIKVDLNNATKIKDLDEKVEDKPAEYVPVIDVKSTNAEFELNTIYKVEKPKAYLGEEELPVVTNAYYIENGQKKALEINEDLVKLDKVGEYHFVYYSESEKYKTLLGNNTSSKVDIRVDVKIGAKALAKIEFEEGALPKGVQVQSGYLTSGDLFNTIKDTMAKKADNYQVFSIELWNEAGESIKPNGPISLYLLANETYNRNDIEVYYVNEEGALTPCEVEGYGRYVKINTSEVGTFVVCVPGVEFHMPMWGYAVITIVAVLVVAAAVTITIILVKKHKKDKRD